MKKKIIGICFLLTMCLLGGCGKEKKENNDQSDEANVVFEFAGEPVTKGEVYIYLNTVKEQYEKEYGADVWEKAFEEDANEGTTVEALIKEAVITEIVRVSCYSEHAGEFDIRLSETDENEINQDADKFFNGLTEQDKQYYALTRDEVYRVMYKNKLSQLVRTALLDKNKIEFSDEEARMTTFYDMYFPCYYVDGDSVVEYNEEQKDIQYQNALNACSTLATAILDENKDAENIEKLAEYYKLDEAGEHTMTPEDIKETYGEQIYELLYNMDNGEYSTVVESEYGYHVFEMLELTDQSATTAHKEEMTNAAIDKLFTETLDKWINEMDSAYKYPDSVNMDVYNSIKLTN